MNKVFKLKMADGGKKFEKKSLREFKKPSDYEKPGNANSHF